jgi:uncharacterized membrane protein
MGSEMLSEQCEEESKLKPDMTGNSESVQLSNADKTTHCFQAQGVAGIAVRYMAGSIQSRPMYLRKNNLKINQVNKVTKYFLFTLCYYCQHVTLLLLLTYFAVRP